MNSGLIPVDKGELYFETNGIGEPILFVHGFSLDHRMWQPQIEHFRNQYQTICYDMRGFGKSSLPTGEYSHHDDMKYLLNTLGIDKIHLVGLSLGGEMSIDFVITYPDRVKSLTLIDSSLGGYPCNVDWRVYAEEQGLDQAKQNWMKHDVFKPSCQKSEVKKLLEQFVCDYSGWHWLHHDPRIKVVPSAMERLSEIKVPTQIIVGENDLENYHLIANVIHKKVEKSSVTILPNTGHMANLENPEQINHLIHSFVE